MTKPLYPRQGSRVDREDGRIRCASPVKTTSMLLSALGALALVMPSVGLYAILAYAVSQRTREIGIRMALGAQRREILGLVMQRTVILIGWGIGLGCLGGVGLNRRSRRAWLRSENWTP